MRNRFVEQLSLLNREIIEMGSLCEEAILKSNKALMEGDVTLALSVKKEAPLIDQKEREIENLCMKLLLHQQPVAKDLRFISAALKMITDMERIGDQAEDIADLVASLDGKTSEHLGSIEQMAKKTLEMLVGSVDAFVKKDIQLANAVLKADDLVDEYFKENKNIMIDLIRQHQIDGEYALDLLMIAKYFERIADHATNIAEWVIYSLTGSQKGLKK